MALHRRHASQVVAPVISHPRVLFASSEVAPFIKTGGLADVSASLPAALRAAGVDVRIVLPGYGSVLKQLTDHRVIAEARLSAGDIALLETHLPGTDVPVWLVQCSTLFDREGGPYSQADGSPWPDNAQRFGVFCQAVAWLCRGGARRSASTATRQEFLPDVVHLNDWQTGLAAAYLASDTTRPGIVFGIHNLAYQGLFGRAAFTQLGLPEHLWSMQALEFYGEMSFMKGGIAFADALVTVSPTYAQEIQTAALGNGLDGLLRERSAVLAGILNGIANDEWNPATDPQIAATYDANSLERKAFNTRALRNELGLMHSDQPLIGCIGRLAYQKGIDIVLEAADALIADGMQLVVLGSGEQQYVDALTAAARRHPGRVAFSSKFDEGMAHRIEAGADLFLMPSRYEPSGLNQMYSMRYGTLPIVSRTGGLADTVEPIPMAGPQAGTSGTGFVIDALSSDALRGAIQNAERLWLMRKRWRAAQQRGMAKDFSWQASVGEYLHLYAAATTAATKARSA